MVPAAMSEQHLQALRWLYHEAPALPNTSALIQGLANQLDTLGLELLRINVQVRTLHPEVQVVLYIWRRDTAVSEPSEKANIVGSVVEHTQPKRPNGIVREFALAHGSYESPQFRVSPFYLIMQGAPFIYASLAPEQTEFAFPIFKDLVRDKATGYLALPIRLSSGVISACSFVTGKVGGFFDDEIDFLRELVVLLALLLEIHSQHNVMRTLLHTYLGREPGERVLSGKIQRGDVERIEAAIWFSDMRGFTKLSSTLNSETLIAWLNDYFGVISAPIARHGGEVLKFIGDAVLAIFPVAGDRSAPSVCQAALLAAKEAHSALDAQNVVVGDFEVRPEASRVA